MTIAFRKAGASSNTFLALLSKAPGTATNKIKLATKIGSMKLITRENTKTAKNTA